jgi:protein associated with RNAse G/E
MTEITVIKENLQHQETWRYPAEVLETRANAVLLEAFFNREDTDVHGLVMARGDRFVEIYYSDRWYNIYEIYGKTDRQLKGWYCNVSLPAEITAHEIHYVDLALDLLVFPDGRQLVLDEDEFNALGLDPLDQEKAREALQQLHGLFQHPDAVRLAKS